MSYLNRLSWATSVCHDKYPYFVLVDDWKWKFDNLAVYLMDLPHLQDDYKTRGKQTYEANAAITLVDKVPAARLASACEAITNCLYGAAEVASGFANRATAGGIPRSFNKLRKKIAEGSVDEKLAKAMGDLQWYRKVRELRTEWVHFSTVFIGEESGEPVLIVQANRRMSDREEFSKKTSVCIEDLSLWINRAIATLDSLAGYLLYEHVLGLLDFDLELGSIERDENGLPRMEENRLVPKRTTIRLHLEEGGVI